jgi:hypothetical protein
MEMLRGHEIHMGPDEEFVFSDTGASVPDTWESRPCGYCGRSNTPEGYDGCVGHLPGVRNACCGHGQLKAAYIQYVGGRIIRGIRARTVILIHSSIGRLTCCLRNLLRRP